MDQPTPAAAMAPAVADPGPHAGIGFREFVGIVAATMGMVALGIDTMLPALPAIGRALAVPSENQRQLIITVYLLAFGGGQLLYGPLSDRYGRKRLLLPGMAAYVAASLAAAVAPSFATLLAARAVQGLAIAGARVIIVSIVRDCYSGRQMARVMSLAFMVFLAVPVLAPSIGQFVLLFVSWRGLFAILAGYGLLVTAWVAARMPETLHPAYRRPVDLRSIGAAVARALTTRQAVGYMAAQTAMLGALYGFVNSVQQVFADVFHRPTVMPTVFAGIAGMMAVANLLNSRVVERFGTRRLSHAALIAFAVIELAHLAVAVSGHETIATFAICQAVAMFCYGIAAANFGAMAMEPLASIAGTAASTQGFLSVVIGASLGFAIGQRFDGTTVPMTAGFAIAGIVALAIVVWTERGRLFRPVDGR